MSFEVGRLSAALTLEGVDKFTSDLDSAGRKLDATGKAASKAGDLYQDSAGKWRNAAGQFATAAEQAAAGVKGTSDAAGGLLSNIQRLATDSPTALTTVGSAFTTVGVVAAAASGTAIAKWANFDQAMSAVQAATHESADSMKQLEQAALDAGARTVFSATEAANAIEELAKAGVSTADILSGGLDGALDLAAAGGLGVADAAGIAATALQTFKLEGSDMAHVADLLAAGAGKAMGDVSDLSQALNQSAMVANATGLSIEETTAGLAAFASQGLLGSDAGTSFKSMLQSLTPTSGKAAETMAELGISAYDSQGNFIGLAEFAGQLQGALSTLTVEQQQAALKTIFGSDAIRAATVLYSEGEAGIREWISAVDDQGYAAETATARLDNLKGDLEALGGALDTAFIQSGSGANDALRGMVQLVTEAVDAYNSLPAPLQSATLGIGLLVAGVGLLGGAFMRGTVQLAEFRAASAQIGLNGANMRKGLGNVASFLGGPWGIALMAATISVAGFNQAMDASKVSAQEMENAIKQGEAALATMQDKANSNESGLTGALVDVSQHLDNLPALADKAASAGRGFWSSMSFNENAALDSVKAFGDSLQSLAASDLPRAQDAFKDFVSDAGLNDAQALTLMNEEMTGFKSSLIDLANASGLATDDASLLQLALGEIAPSTVEAANGSGQAADAITTMGEQAEAAQEAVDALADSVSSYGSTVFDSREANRQLEDSYKALADALGANGLDFEVASEAGRENQRALDDVASSTNEAAAAILAAGGSQEEMNAKLAEGRSRLTDILEPYFGSRDAAAEYVAQLDLISPEKVTDIVANISDAVIGIQSVDDLTVDDKLLSVDADTAAALTGIDGVQVIKINDKTSVVLGENADAVAKIQQVINSNPGAKTVPVGADDFAFWAAWRSIQIQETIRKTVQIVTETFTVDKGSGHFAGGMYTGGTKNFAGGGFASGIYRGVVGGIPKFGLDGSPHIFAEAEMGVPWEAYISGRSGSRSRNVQIAMEALDRLGFPVVPASALRGVPHFADGGTVSRAAPAVSAPMVADGRRERRRGRRGILADRIYIGADASTNDYRNAVSVLGRMIDREERRG